MLLLLPHAPFVIVLILLLIIMEVSLEDVLGNQTCHQLIPMSETSLYNGGDGRCWEIRFGRDHSINHRKGLELAKIVSSSSFIPLQSVQNQSSNSPPMLSIADSWNTVPFRRKSKKWRLTNLFFLNTGNTKFPRSDVSSSIAGGRMQTPKPFGASYFRDNSHLFQVFSLDIDPFPSTSSLTCKSSCSIDTFFFQYFLLFSRMFSNVFVQMAFLPVTPLP